MKKIRFVALAVAMLMLAMCAVACSSEKITVNCTVSVQIGEEVFLDSYAYAVTNKVETPPTILQAVSEVFQMVEYNYAVDEEGLSLTAVTVDGTDYLTGLSADGTAIGFWGCTVNGAEPEEGRMGNTVIKEGDHVVVYFDSQIIEEQEFSDPEA